MRKMKADPLIDAGVRGLIINMAKRNFWRVAAWYDVEDLIQDGYLCWFKVRNAYPKIECVRHMTALFRTTFERHIINLANSKREQREVCMARFLPPGTDDVTELEAMLGWQDEEQTAFVLLRNMPEELRQLWRFLRSEDGRQKLREPRLKVLGVRETTNEHLCRLLGLDPRYTDLVKLAHQHFHGEGRDDTSNWAEFFKERLAKWPAAKAL